MGENSHDVTAVPTLENTTIGELTINALNQLDEYDAVVFGITARFGMMSAQMKGVFDSMSSLWARGALMGKLSTCFFATGTQAGGQESTALTTIACMAHHGLIYVPTGYSFERMKTNTELNGGSPFGSGTFAGDGTRTPSDYEKEYAQHHGKIFGATVKALKLGQA